ncbi:MAG TPA: UDP-glucose/GDP-mannose dehydrogenase family protein [Trebonia sp.]|nr:UDP-glucose/GDP-mannose dehydrogenase family protein [Trebonia sp.]
MRVTAIGIGYLGLTHAVCMADLGHQVLAIDVDVEKVEKASRGETPFFEPGLEPLLRKNLDAGRLRLTTSFQEIAEFGEVHFLCVGTPQKPGETAADLSYVYGAIDAIAPHLTQECLIVGKSTVPVGTARDLLNRVQATAPAGQAVNLLWNPEFLREGYAVQDTLTPDRFVFGVTSDEAGAVADATIREVYATPLNSGIPGITMDLETAELVKVSANSFLATKISFINAMAEMCEAAGADVIALANAIGIDERIGRKFLSPGLGFGGGCLPKDIRAFRTTAGSRGVDSIVRLLTTVDDINLGRRERVTTLAREAVGGDLTGKKIAVLGIAFKPNTDDLRDSPSLDICHRLVSEGAIVSVHDPVANANAARSYPGFRYADSVHEALADAEVVLHLTEWAEFRAIDPVAVAEIVASKVLIDARSALDADAWNTAGWTVYRPGQPAKLA